MFPLRVWHLLLACLLGCAQSAPASASFCTPHCVLDHETIAWPSLPLNRVVWRKTSEESLTFMELHCLKTVAYATLISIICGLGTVAKIPKWPVVWIGRRIAGQFLLRETTCAPAVCHRTPPPPPRPAPAPAPAPATSLNLPLLWVLTNRKNCKRLPYFPYRRRCCMGFSAKCYLRLML